MKLKYFLLLILFNPITLGAQILSITIQNEDKAVHQTTIEKNGVFYSTSEDYTLNIPVESNDRITIKHEIYKDYYLELPDGLITSDTINKIVKLTLKLENFKLQIYNELTILESKYIDIFDNENEFIIDYYPFPLNQFFVISKYKKDYFLKIINSFGDELFKKNLDFAPNEIFLDALGNFHLIDKDSVYQIYIDNNFIYLMKPLPNHIFEVKIRNLVSLSEKGAYHQENFMHNKLYSLTREINQNIDNVYQSFDKIGYTYASYYYYYKVVGYYMSHTPIKDNIILMGIWDGDLMTLNNYDVDILNLTSWSDKITSKPTDVKSYEINDKIIVLDDLIDSIYHFDQETLAREEFKVDFVFSGDYFKDYFYDNIYMYSQDKNGIIVSKIDIKDGTTKKIAQLTDMRQPRNIKVINDKVYFTKLDDSQYNRIVEVK